MPTVDSPASAEAAWRQLYLTYATIFKAIERAIAPTRVTLPQALALAAIKNEPRPMTPSRLAHQLTQETQSVTGLIDRMEKQGWVRRVRDLPDRRAIRIELTAEGAAKLDGTLAPSAALTERMFGSLSASETAQFIALLDRVCQSAAGQFTGEEERT